MKRSNLSYAEWTCIRSKSQNIKRISSDFFTGHLSLIEIKEVTVPQIWNFRGEDIVVCDKGIKWLSILPRDDYYCITAMMDENDEILLWYIDMIAAQGIGEDGIPYFDDLYLDLVVYPDGTIVVDDMDELEDALETGDITEAQFQLALDTGAALQKGMLSDISAFKEYTKKCCEAVRK